MHEPTHERALKLARDRISPRAKLLERLERFVECTQYDDREVEWFDNTSATPLWERRPCIVYPIVQSAIQSNVDLCLGEGRFPEVTARPDEDDADWSDTGLSDTESELFDFWLSETRREARFKAHCRQILASAQGAGTAVGLFGVRSGKLFAESTRARWCEPDLDVDGNVQRLVIQYPYLEQYREDGKWKWRAMLYRREIDAIDDTVMVPAEILSDSWEPRWVPQSVVTHGFGFCPVIWYPFLKGAAVANAIDGNAIHAHCLDEISAHDIALSQRHRAALFAGDPQVVEIGVAPGHCPTEMGQTANVETWPVKDSATGDIIGQERSKWHSGNPGGAPARKKGPGYVWQYPDEKTKVEILTLPPGALEALDKHAHDIRTKIAESLCVVFMDPENVKFAATVSGKALDTLRKRQTDRCDQIRDDFGDKYLIPAQNMLVRIGAHFAARGKKGELRTPGLDKVTSILAKFRTEEPNAGPVAIAG